MTPPKPTITCAPSLVVPRADHQFGLPPDHFLDADGRRAGFARGQQRGGYIGEGTGHGIGIGEPQSDKA